MKLRRIAKKPFSIILFTTVLLLALPLIAAAQGKIVFTSTRDGNFEIYSMDASGTNQTRLTTNADEDFFPSLSPDGTKIVFSSKRDGNDEIYIMNVDGTNQTRLTNSPGIDYESSFSPDGSKIIFSSMRDGNLEIYLMDANGANQTRITNNSAADRAASFSSDGSKIVFESNRRGFCFEIYVMNANGTNQTRLTDDNSGAECHHNPSFNPAGNKIVFSDSGSTAGLHIVDSNGSNRTLLFHAPFGMESYPSFSPDGSKIVFASGGGSSDIYTINANGTDPYQLTSTVGTNTAPSWGVEANAAPTITAFGASLARDSSASGVSIASVNDAEDAENDLSVTVNGGSNATVNNVTISNIAVGSTGNVTANISTTCGATNAGFTLRVTDGGGLFAEATLNVTVTNETTDPTLSLPADIVTSLPLNSIGTSKIVNFTVSATDNCDANPTVTATPASGSAFPVGTTTVNVTATDASGNTTTGSFTVTVLYNFAGFFQPVDNLPVVNMVSAGQSVPLKFSLSGNKGLNIFAAGFPTSQQIACVGGLPVSSVEETVTAGSSSLSYDATGDRYIYVWKTEKAWRGTCRQLIVKLNDGSLHTAYFQFK